MPDLFIAILVAFGFWSRQSKDQKIRTCNASWLRTSVYFVLLVMVGVFYYKSNQIPVITHEIHIFGMKQATVDSNKTAIQDKASLYIVSRFDNNNLFKHLFEYHKENKRIDNVKIHDEGEVAVKLLLYNDSSTIFTPNVNENNKFYIDNNPLYEDMYNHYYAVSMVSSRITSISPFQKDIKKHSLDGVIDLKSIENMDSIPAYYYAVISSMNEAQKNNAFNDSAIYGYFDKNAICSIQYLWTKKGNNKENISAFLPIESNVLNSMNIFSAADLSQCTYIISAMSECPLENVYFNFDVPVEMLPSKYKPTQLDAYDICFKDSFMLEQIRNHDIFLHVKMPTMQNLQLVRSLILTTLLTALLSLFLSNLYYAIRKNIKRCKRRKSKPQLDFSFLRRIKKYWEKSLHRTIYFILLVFLVLTVQRCENNYILIDIEKIGIFNGIVIILFLAIVIYYIVLFYKIKNGKYKKKDENSDDVSKSDMIKYLVEKKAIKEQEEKRVYSEHIKDYGDSIMMEETEGDDNDEEKNKEEDNANSI